MAEQRALASYKTMLIGNSAVGATPIARSHLIGFQCSGVRFSLAAGRGAASQIEKVTPVCGVYKKANFEFRIMM
ncbi:MAG: hypothetical protein KJO34_19255, partial [Deltaproteobacteria bacterium]|nr:hypothetical protein [Deltaproteobacteria bacterium]